MTPEQIAALRAARAAGRTLTTEENAAVEAFDAAMVAFRALAPVAAPLPVAAPPAPTATAVVVTADQLEAARTAGVAAEQSRIEGIRQIATEHGNGVAGLDAAVAKAIKDNLNADQFGRTLLTLRKAEPTQDAPVGQVNYKDRDLSKYSVMNVIRALKGEGRLSGLELEIHQEHIRAGDEPNHGGYKIPLARIMRAQRDAVSTATQASGGAIVKTEYGEMVDLLRNKSVMLSLGIRSLEGLVGSLDVPRKTAAGTAYWVGEGVDGTRSRLSLGNIGLDMKTVVGITEITRKMRKQTSQSIEQMVRDDLLETLGLAIDLAILSGSGASGQPLGILNTSGIGSVASGSATYAKILEFESDLATGNAMQIGRPVFLATPGVKGILKNTQRFSNTDTPLWEKDDTVNGYKAYDTNQMAAGTSVLVVPSAIMLGLWGAPEVKIADQGDNYKSGNEDILVFNDADVALRQPAAVSYCASLT